MGSSPNTCPLVLFPKRDPINAQTSFQVREYEEKIDRLERTVDQQRREIDNLKNVVQNLDGTVSAADQRVAGLAADSEQRHNSTSHELGTGRFPESESQGVESLAKSLESLFQESARFYSTL